MVSDPDVIQMGSERISAGSYGKRSGIDRSQKHFRGSLFLLPAKSDFGEFPNPENSGPRNLPNFPFYKRST